MPFQLTTKLKPTGDQPRAIESLTTWLRNDIPRATLLGVTGSGKTFTFACVIQALQRPTLVISHNKTLASQLYHELKEFFPRNAVHYFVSYYDYYQPEAYIPRTDTYIEKDAAINEEIDRLRHAATQALLTREDVIIVASVSCIYNIGSPVEYEQAAIPLRLHQPIARTALLRLLTNLQYERNDIALTPGTFRARGEIVDIFLPTGSEIIRVELFGENVERLGIARMGKASELLSVEAKSFAPAEEVKIFPAKHFVTPQDKLDQALARIEDELKDRLNELRRANKLIEAQRLAERTTYDLEMLKTTGFCSGIENYSRQLEFRQPGGPPHTLLEYFPKNFLTFIDESHMSIPQIRGMYNGDRSRKQTLVDFGFRLPSALDNRPLRFNEFEQLIGQTVFVSATPGPYERTASRDMKTKTYIAQQLIRPTGLLDPTIAVHPTIGQLSHLEKAIKERTGRRERTIITTLTKRSAEHLTEYLVSHGIKAVYLHGDIHTLERPEILYKFRKGEFDALVGINLLREGLDLPEVSLVVILDADKEGFLRNETTLIQTMGRAARHKHGHVILYADSVNESMRKAIEETKRRRSVQEAYNHAHNITPRSVKKAVRPTSLVGKKTPPAKAMQKTIRARIKHARADELDALVASLEKEMLEAAEALEFERAAVLRDELKRLSHKHLRK